MKSSQEMKKILPSITMPGEIVRIVLHKMGIENESEACIKIIKKKADYNSWSSELCHL